MFFPSLNVNLFYVLFHFSILALYFDMIQQIEQDRSRIESDFFGGKLCGIAATNALELGIDVGHIDVTLHIGFPGSTASLWQQAGSSGRRERPSLVVYVAFGGPLDQ